MSCKSYEDKAIEFAERYGIRDYKVVKNQMTYKEYFRSGTWKGIVNLDTMKETRKQIKGGK